MLNLQRQTGPLIEPLTLTQAKQFLRLDSGFTSDDTLIEGLLPAVREIAENYTRRAFFNQTWVLSLDAFPWWNFASGTVNPAMRKGWPLYSSYWDPLAIRLPRPRCLQVVSITYVDLTNAVQTLDPATYSVDTSSEPARIVPMPNLTWPSTQLYVPGSVKVTFECASYVQAASQNITAPSSSPYQVQLPGTVTGVTSVLNGSTPVTGWSVAANGLLTLPSASAGEALTVNYSTADCPQTLQFAMLLILSHLYENRLPVIDALTEMPWGITALLQQYAFEQFTYENGN